MKQSKKVSFSAILAALAVIVMLIGSVVETVTLATAGIASLCIMIAVLELGKTYAFMIYAAASVLALLLLPVKDPAIFFALSFGYYPILKLLIEKIKNKIVAYALKGCVFTAAFSALFLIAIKFLVPNANLTKYAIVWYLFGLLIFFAFDYAFSKLIRSYFFSLRKRLGIDKLLK